VSVRFVAVGLIVLLGACSSAVEPLTAQPSEEVDVTCPTEGEPMAAAKLYIEHNATDADTGVHGLFEGDGWELFCLRSPSGELLMSVRPGGPLGELGLADLFFESREPPNTEYPIEQLRELFPAGSYQASGVDVEGVSRVGSARFTHAIPAEPTIVTPALSEDEAQIDSLVDLGALAVSWEPVTESLAREGIDVSGYQVIVTSIDDEDPDGWSVPVFDIHLPATATSVTVPDGFLASGAAYELELLVLESSGNQTISLGFFEVR
jgi:hypothetical protein